MLEESPGRHKLIWGALGLVALVAIAHIAMRWTTQPPSVRFVESSTPPTTRQPSLFVEAQSEPDRVAPKVSLNQATVTELTTVPGIDEKLAIKIIESRVRSGPFRSVDDLIRVNGVGPKKLEELVVYLTP